MPLPEVTEEEWSRRRQVQLEKMISLLSRQLLTDQEFATSFVHRAIKSDKDRLQQEQFDLLPEIIQQQVLLFLNEIAANGYRWRPLMLGRQYSEDELAEIGQRTHTFHKMLLEGPQKS